MDSTKMDTAKMDSLLTTLGGGSEHGGSEHKYYDIQQLPGVKRMPFCLRVMLEAVVRTCDGFEVQRRDVDRLLDYERSAANKLEIAFKPARVLLQDFTGVPSVVDLAAMRDAVVSLGAPAEKVNPLIPTDLVIDHSVVVDFHGTEDALAKNEDREFDRNQERFAFLKWGQKAFNNVRVVPPGSGIVHQVNLEFLARVVFQDGPVLYPDSVVGTDSHTTMIDGLGVLGWGVGGIEAEATMLNQPIYLVVPEVVGFKLTGKLPVACTPTDLVLKIAQMMREYKVVGKLVEFYGDGVASLTVADRATIANMSPEFGCTAAYFPCDRKTMEYLAMTGRDKAKLDLAEQYLKAVGLFNEGTGAEKEIKYCGKGMTLDLSTLRPAVAGPKRPHDFCTVEELGDFFGSWLTDKVGFRGYGLASSQKTSQPFTVDGETVTLDHGSVVIAAITSCTNTSNPMVMMWAGLLAQKARARGLRVPPYVKCSLSPGSHVVHEYLSAAGLIEPLKECRFYLTGFGCQTCIGNSGDLDEAVSRAIQESDIVAAAVLSGNRNFEGRIHPLTRANFLMSPPLVVAYALAGRVDIDFRREPVGVGSDGRPVMLADIWPSPEEVSALVDRHLTPDMFIKVYSHILTGRDRWEKCPVPKGQTYQWDEKSTYIHKPPFFDGMGKQPKPIEPITRAFCLLNLGDSITTDHISPAGKIALDSPAAEYLRSRGVQPKDFNSYGSRRGNDEVMVRGTFANVRLVNKLVAPKVGPVTLHVPTDTELPIFQAAMKYREAGHASIILAGQEYGSGSSRDWAAKGPLMLGVRAVIAQSFERIHRSNLVGMGILPLQFKEGQSADALKLTGRERFSIDTATLEVGKPVEVVVYDTAGDKEILRFTCVSRIDTSVELEYYRNGGILQYVLRKIAV